MRKDTSFTGVHLADGVEPATFLASIRSRVNGWDASGAPPFTYVAPVRPPEIVNADAMRTAPAMLAGVLASALLVALGLSIGSTVNAAACDYAIYRTIGFRRAQVGRSVRWQSLTTMAIGVVIGIPLGIVGGRFLWSRFAERARHRARRSISRRSCSCTSPSVRCSVRSSRRGSRRGAQHGTHRPRR